jgi:hypothetical protein
MRAAKGRGGNDSRCNEPLQAIFEARRAVVHERAGRLCANRSVTAPRAPGVAPDGLDLEDSDLRYE